MCICEIICEIVCVYAKLFKTILDTGIIPERWTIVIIRSIYKNNGNSKNLDSHRTITLISCLGKLFTGFKQRTNKVVLVHVSKKKCYY
jgi:hypothetical protein